jgi:transposase-like protein
MGRNVKKSKEESLAILREYLSTDLSKGAICRKYGLNRNWVYKNLIKFAVADKKSGVAMKKLPGNVSVEKNYRDSERENLLRRIRELEIELRKTEMARDAYDEMIRLAEQYYNIPIRKKSAAK